MKKINIILIIIVFGLVSCNKEKIEGKIKTDPEFATELKSTPENVVIGSNTFFLRTGLWRDFMPTPDNNRSAMICLNFLTEKDSSAIMSIIELKKQYVVKGDEVWTAEYSEVKKSEKSVIEGVVREGPKWEPLITVDVICEFEVSGTVYRVLSKSQKIGAAY